MKTGLKIRETVGFYAEQGRRSLAIAEEYASTIWRLEYDVPLSTCVIRPLCRVAF